ncbi:MAG: TraU family protein [Candidatus Thiodiazotropha lotti]|nr:TraU family protein [Candidatus Thiodiazotropha lotti]MCW4222843.1 TraU family protein [Candidatus Thiodiazotropha lotti]
MVEGFAAEECLDYCIVGVCFWLVGCPYCEIETTAKIQHRLPDLVVTAFKLPGENPWTEGRNVYGEFAKNSLENIMGDEADGSATIMEGGEERSDVMFNEVHVIGNPVAYVSESFDYLCDTESMPIPYFLSEVDSAAWRDPRSESWHYESYTPGAREIWGIGTSVYPRVGYAKQPDPPKAAATAAQRAIDLVLQNYQLPHIYIPFSFANNNSDMDGMFEDPSSNSGTGGTTGSGSGTDGGENVTGGMGDSGSSGSSGSEGGSGLWSFTSDGFDPENDSMVSDFSSLVQSGTEGDTQVEGGFFGNIIKWMEPGLEDEKAWQMISPTKQDACEAFTDLPDDWSDDKQSEEYTFGWQYWRKYKCCVPGNGAYIGSAEFEPICVIGSNDY